MPKQDVRTGLRALRDVTRTYFFLPQFAIQRSVELLHLRSLTYPRPILDLGCGDAAFTRLVFPERGSVDYGLDPEPDQLERARSSGIFRELFSARGDRIPLPDGSIRTVFSNSVFEHIREIEPVLAECSRVLAEGGRLIFTTPSEHFPEFLFFSQRYRAWGHPEIAEGYVQFVNSVFGHYRYWTLGEWEKALARSGFTTQAHRQIVSERATLLEDKWMIRQLALRTLSPGLAKRVEGSFARTTHEAAPRAKRTFLQRLAGFGLYHYLALAFFRKELSYHGPGSQYLFVAEKR